MVSYFLTSKSIPTILKYIEFLLLAIGIKDLEFIDNFFRPPDRQLRFGIMETFFFTNIALFFTLAVILFKVISGYNKNFARIHSFLLPCVLILEIFVTVMFWSLFLYSPRLVKRYKEKKGSVFLYYYSEFPRHLFPLTLLIIECYLSGIKKMQGQVLFLIFFWTGYFIANELLLQKFNIYLYEFFRRLSFFARFCLILSIFFISCIIYYYLPDNTLKAILAEKDIPGKSNDTKRN